MSVISKFRYLFFLIVVVAPYFFQVNLASADAGLVAHWTFDDGSGSTISDSSGSGNDMGLSGTASWTNGKVGTGALSLDGSSNYAYLNTFNNTPASTMTLCGWVKTSSATDQTIISFSRNQNSNNNEGMLRVLANGSIQFWDYSNTYGFPYNAPGSSHTVIDGHWHLACFVKSGTSGTYYVDGVQDGTITAATNVTYGNYDWVLGADYRDHDSYFNGLMDDVRVYNIALSRDQIAGLYGLIGYWKFDDGSGSAAIDSSGHGDNGTLNGPSWVAGKINGALQFNGGSNYVEIPDAPILEPTSSISVSAWVYAPSFSSQNAMIVTKNPVNTDWQLFLDTGPSREGAGGIKWRSGSSTPGIVAPFPTDGQWHQVTVTQSGTSAIMYIDGTNVASGTVASLGTIPGTIDIGRFESNSYFNGSIDDVRIYNRALSLDEVATFMELLPNQVSNLNVTGNYNDGFSLTWNANPEGDSVSDYIMEYSTDNGNSWNPVDTASTTTSYYFAGNGPSDYLFHVKAVNSFGQSSPSNQVEINAQPITYQLGNSCTDLENIATTPGDPYGHYVMTGDIDCSGVANFMPIDFSSNGFEGIFNGQGYKILNLNIDASTTTQVAGLFKWSTGATFENVKLVGGSVDGDYQVGSLVGYANNTTINNIVSNLHVSGVDQFESWAIGGLVGEADHSTISNSSASGDVDMGGYANGGLAGYVYDLTLDHSFATGNVTGGQSVGGLVGDAYDDGGLNASECYATGNISGGDGVGGIVGQLGQGSSLGATITNCYAIGNISKNLNYSDSYYNFGGLVGYINNAQISNSYYAGIIAGSNNLGGLVGAFSNSSLSDSFSAVSIVLDSAPVGAVIGNDNGLTGFNDNPPLNDVVYDASHYGGCDGSYDGIPNGCAPVNTDSSPDTTYFFNTTSNTPFSNNGSVWDFTSIWKKHLATYPTLIGVGPDVEDPIVPATSTPPTPVVSTPTRSGSSGSTVQSRVNNLIALGNNQEAQNLITQYPKAFLDTGKNLTSGTLLSKSKDLSSGMSNSRIYDLQQFLIAENKGPSAKALKKNGPSNYFGKLTKVALIEFQKSVGIKPATGIFGPKTRAYLKSIGH